MALWIRTAQSFATGYLDQLGFAKTRGRDAMIDLPLAAVRRHLLAGKRPPRHVAELVRALTELILTAPRADVEG